MEKLTDWARMWAELSKIQEDALNRKKEKKSDDLWKGKARKYDQMVDRRWEKPDSSRDFIVQILKENPGSSLLDIGAGTGKWATLAASFADRVTALEPSSAMQAVLKEKIVKQGIGNICLMDGVWPRCEVKKHDYVLASHSMYGVADLRAFVEKMGQVARKACIMVIRAPYRRAVMAQAALKVLGQPYDSPNFQIAYNLLLGLDIYPRVIMEEKGNWAPWKNDSIEQALADVKNRLGLVRDSGHDDFLRTLLEENLTRQGDEYVWPPGNRSALMVWEV